MQNANRAKNLAYVEAEKAKVKDDAEWEVAKEVREAWGIGSSSTTSGWVLERAMLFLSFSSWDTV